MRSPYGARQLTQKSVLRSTTKYVVVHHTLTHGCTHMLTLARRRPLQDAALLRLVEAAHAARPNRLLVQESAAATADGGGGGGGDGVVGMSAAKMAALELYEGDAVLVRGKKRKEAVCVAAVDGVRLTAAPTYFNNVLQHRLRLARRVAATDLRPAHGWRLLSRAAKPWIAACVVLAEDILVYTAP
jgi:hypothetical protein